MEDSLVEAIRSSRKEFLHDHKVTYDLTHSVEISNPRKVAEALARVVFEEDVSKWIKEYDYTTTIEAAWDVEIIMHDENYKKVRKAALDFRKDLEKEKIDEELSGEIKKQGRVLSSAKEYIIWIIVGGLGFWDATEHDYAVGASNRARYVGALMADIMNHVTVIAKQ